LNKLLVQLTQEGAVAVGVAVGVAVEVAVEGLVESEESGEESEAEEWDGLEDKLLCNKYVIDILDIII